MIAEKFLPKACFILPETSLSHNVVPSTTATTARSETVQSKFSVDYDRLIENIKDLNVLAGEGVSKVHHTTDGARLRVSVQSPHTTHGARLRVSVQSPHTTDGPD